MNRFSVFFFSRNRAYSQVISYLHSLNMPFTMSGIPPSSLPVHLSSGLPQ